MSFRLILLWTIIFWDGLLFGQSEGLKFRNYGIKEGLSQSTIINIFQDKKGFLWFATSDGLNQFDGYSFTIYKNNYLNANSLSDSWVAKFFEDSDDELWMFTADRSINLLNLHTQRITRFIPGKSELLNFPPFDRVYYILEDRNKNIWISTNSGICRYNKKQMKFTLYHDNPTLPSNLKENFVFYMYEDSNGDLWFAASDGLYRYHDKTDSFESYSNQSGGLLSRNIIKIEEDKSHNLWIFTSKGLNLYQPKSNTFIAYPIDHKIYYDLNAAFFSAKIGRNGFIWLGTARGLYRFDPKMGHYYFYEHKPGVKGTLSNNEITCLIEGKSGNIWIGTSNGLNKYNAANNDFEGFYSNGNNDSNHIINILEDKNGDILTIGKLEPAKGGYLSYLNKETRKLELQLNDKCNRNSIPCSFVYQPFNDKSGNIWLGTFGDGVVQYLPRTTKFEYYPPMAENPDFLGGNTVWGFAEDNDGNIWMPLYDKGIDKFNPKTKKFVHFKSGINKFKSLPPNSTIFSITSGKNGDLWMASIGHGILKYNTKTEQCKLYLNNPGNPNSLSSNFIRKIVLDPAGKFWIGNATSGLDYFDPITETAVHYKNKPNDKNSLSSNNIWSLLQDKSSNVWISCDGYIDRYNPSTKQFTHYKSKSNDLTGIIADRALCMFEDSQGNIWFGTDGGGLSKYNWKTDKFRHWTESEGLPNNVIYGILEDNQGCLWLSTNKGLSRFNVRKNSFKNYDENDGLQSNEFNMGAYFKSRDNKLYFGGINGFNSFYPDKIKSDTSALNTVITGIQLFNKEIQVVPPDKEKLMHKNDPSLIIRDDKTVYLPQNITYSNEITLTYLEKVFTLEYAALSFKSQEKTTYRYMMENFDGDWNYAGTRRFATYTNLPEGNYLFKVSAANSDGIWNLKPTILKVRILPPFWRTWWFLLCEGIFIFGIIMLVMRLRVMSLKHAKEVLEKKVNQRTWEIKEKNEELELRNLQIIKQKEEIATQAQQLKTELTTQNQTSEMALLRSQINPHFLFNTLNNIYSLVYQRSDEAPEAVMKLSEIMRYMLYEATSEKVLLQNEINYLKSFIELQLLRIKNREFVSFNITGNFEGRTISPMLLISFVENAFKHGVKRGINPGIIINLDVLDNNLNFEVINYCKKNDTSNKDKTGGIGLTNIKRRLELLYPNKFKLDILKNDEVYQVKLQIEA